MLHKTKNKKADNQKWDLLSLYLTEIGKSPLLSREEEIALAKRAASGDEDARQALVKANLRFVVRVAKEFQNQGLPLEDLISEGNIGLIRAAERFDPGRNLHFISYAVWWIRQALFNALSEGTRLIRLPLNRTGELIRIERARKELEAQYDRKASIKEIAVHLGIKEKLVEDLVQISREHLSLESPLMRHDSDARSLRDLVEDTLLEGPEERAISESLKEKIDEVLATLSEREAAVINERFGLRDRKPKSLKEIGEAWNLTKERIRQIEKQALDKLRHSSRRKLLHAYTLA